MRLLGYTLLLLGFAWLCYMPITLFSTVNPLIHEQMIKIPVKESYSREEVDGAIGISVDTFAEQWPSFLAGALPMLAGGIILDFAGRRRRVPPNTALEPTPTAP
jgi:hypothetical protein